MGELEKNNYPWGERDWEKTGQKKNRCDKQLITLTSIALEFTDKIIYIKETKEEICL
jgi:hypothetical protein